MANHHKKKNTITLDSIDVVQSLTKSAHHCEHGKAFRDATINYHMKQVSNIITTADKILAGNYDMGRLYGFEIFEPKPRQIVANEFPDKVVQRMISKEILEPAIMPVLIYDNYASQPGKGTSLALDRALHFMRSYVNQESNYTDEGCIYEGDIHHFFYSIDRDICSRDIGKLPIDTKCKALVDTSIYALKKYDGSEKGVCIGLQSSQWTAVYYLNRLDHYIKEVLRVKYYGRYMDDFYIIMKDREELEEVVRKIEHFIQTELLLEMNPKSGIHPFRDGLRFLGFRYVYNKRTHDIDIMIRNKTIKRMVKRSKKLCSLVEQGKITVEKALESMKSWNAYASYGHTEKSKAAYKKAVNRIIRVNEVNLAIYRRKLYNDNNLDQFDSDGFFVLKPTENYRDKDGFTILVKRKPRMTEIPKSKKKTKFDRRMKMKDKLARDVLRELASLYD